MLKVAITGGIGSGKTAVSDYIECKGYIVIDADKVAHEITAPGGKAIPEIERIFGKEYIMPDGSMDRAKMRELVYSNQDAKTKLEECTTRVVIKDIEDRVASCESDGEKIVFIVAPLLFEQGCYDGYDEIWLVISDNKTRQTRVAIRDNLDNDSVDRIMKSQLPDSVKMELATEVIDNNSTLDNLYKRVDELIEEINA